MRLAVILFGWLAVGGVMALYFHKEFNKYEGRFRSIQCTQYSFCSERNRDQWLERRELYKILVEIQENSIVNIGSSTMSMNEKRDQLCYDYQSAAFLMDNDSERWPIACLWNGDDRNGTCAPAPPTNRPIGYIIRERWQKMLSNFRESIGCTSKAIWETGKVNELYVCTERCVHGGIGYKALLLISAVLLISITTICFRD